MAAGERDDGLHPLPPRIVQRGPGEKILLHPSPTFSGGDRLLLAGPVGPDKLVTIIRFPEAAQEEARTVGPDRRSAKVERDVLGPEFRLSGREVEEDRVVEPLA